MQMREKLAYSFLLHFSALMLVFLFAGIVQLLFMPSLMDSLRNPIIASMINVMKMHMNLQTDKLLVGMVTFMFFIPLDLAVLYSVTKELFEKDDVMHAIEDGIKLYPLFLVFISDMYFFSFTFFWFSPVVLYTLLRVIEPKINWKTHVVSTALIGSWFLPVALAGRIPYTVTRNVISFLFYLALVFPFFAHAWMINDAKKAVIKRERQ